MITESLLKTVSIGIVAKDIKEDSLYVDVYPVELHPNNNGELTKLVSHNTNIKDSSDNVTNMVVTQTDLVTARWLPDGDTNRLEPPTVCKGEVVRVIQYSDTDAYYWNTLYNQLDLRKREKRTIVVSNKSTINVPKDELLKYSYFALMDSINKLVKLHTSVTDGEYTEYDFTIDTKEGVVEVVDGKGNTVLLDSQDDRIIINILKEMISTTKNRYVNTTENNTETVGNNKRATIGKRYDIALKSFSVNNGRDELITTLSDLVQVVIDATGIGNMGSPVPMDSGTQSALTGIKNRLDGFR